MPRTCRKPRFLVELGPGQKSDQDTDADKEASTIHGIFCGRWYLEQEPGDNGWCYDLC